MLKIKYNRPRPYQISYQFNNCINPVALKSTHTPSFPSGHTASYYLYYLYFSSIDKSNKEKYYNLLMNGSYSRIIGGNHFFYDNDYSIYFINKLLNKVKLF